MTRTEKPGSPPASSLRGDIPAEVMAKLQAAYQASGPSSTQVCPDPETVIVYALEELIPEKRAQVYAHLSECKDCLNLVLDLRSAWAEAQEGKHQVQESTPIRVQVQSWLAGLWDGVSGSLSRLVPLPRLIPVAVALVVLAVAGLGVFQYRTAPRRGQFAFNMTNLKSITIYNQLLLPIDKADNVSQKAPTKARTRTILAFLPLLLKN
jgi:hypothetical protein